MRNKIHDFSTQSKQKMIVFHEIHPFELSLILGKISEMIEIAIFDEKRENYSRLSSKLKQK